MKRKNLDLNDNLKVIHFMHVHNNAAKVVRICKTNPTTVLRCWKNRNALTELSTEKIPGTVKRPLKNYSLQLNRILRNLFDMYARNDYLSVAVTLNLEHCLQLKLVESITSVHLMVGSKSFCVAVASNRHSSCTKKVPVNFQPPPHPE